jgi:hypothetical protein
MQAVELLSSLASAGCRVSADGDRLRVSGPSGAPLTPQLRSALVKHKVELLRLLADDSEVRWRAEAMRPRVPHTGPIPPMYARRMEPVPDGCCLSCGEPLTPGNRYRCEPCVLAAWLVLREVRGRG